jgi:methylmalonyl-CoA mutase, C-terminal domain
MDLLEIELMQLQAAASVYLENGMVERRIRVLVAKPGLDGHDRGAKIIARALRDAGMEVIYTGLRQTPEMIVEAALQEDVDVVGLSILSGAHLTLTPRIIELLQTNGLGSVQVFLGGIIPQSDIPRLLEMGVKGVLDRERKRALWLMQFELQSIEESGSLVFDELKITGWHRKS